MSPLDERRATVGAAGEAFTRAAAACLDWPLDREAIATALFFAALGLVRIAQADGDQAELGKVLQVLRADLARREAS